MLFIEQILQTAGKEMILAHCNKN